MRFEVSADMVLRVFHPSRHKASLFATFSRGLCSICRGSRGIKKYVFPMVLEGTKIEDIDVFCMGLVAPAFANKSENTPRKGGPKTFFESEIGQLAGNLFLKPIIYIYIFVFFF